MSNHICAATNCRSTINGKPRGKASTGEAVYICDDSCCITPATAQPNQVTRKYLSKDHDTMNHFRDCLAKNRRLGKLLAQ